MPGRCSSSCARESPIRSSTSCAAVGSRSGLRTSGMVQHVHTIFGALGMSIADFEPVYLDFAAGAEALAHGEVEAQFQCPIPNKVMTDLAARVDVRVLPYDAGRVEYGGEGRVVLPADGDAHGRVPRTRGRRGAGRGRERAGHACAHVRGAVWMRLSARSSRMREELGRLNPLFAGLAELFAPLRAQGAAALEFGGVSLHRGALAAYQTAGLLCSSIVGPRKRRSGDDRDARSPSDLG